MNFFELVKRKIKENRYVLAVIAIVCLFYSVLFVFGITCPVKFLTGISCPGCGMSRALLSALKLDFSSAFYYHPLWAALPFVIAAMLFLHFRNKKKAFRVLVTLSAAATIALYFLRLFFSESDIVTASLSDGFFVRFFKKIYALAFDMFFM